MLQWLMLIHLQSYFISRMASAEGDVPAEMQDRGKWYGDAVDYWKVSTVF